MEETREGWMEGGKEWVEGGRKREREGEILMFLWKNIVMGSQPEMSTETQFMAN